MPLEFNHYLIGARLSDLRLLPHRAADAVIQSYSFPRGLRYVVGALGRRPGTASECGLFFVEDTLLVVGVRPSPQPTELPFPESGRGVGELAVAAVVPKMRPPAASISTAMNSQRPSADLRVQAKLRRAPTTTADSGSAPGCSGYCDPHTPQAQAEGTPSGSTRGTLAASRSITPPTSSF